jgi:acetyltransferase-like isoleucine patch superfamily enzyme
MTTEKGTEVHVPFTDANDEVAILTSWLVEDGQFVSEGEVIAEIETSKSISEIESPINGVIELRADEGDEVKIGTIIALINSSLESTPSKKKDKSRHFTATNKAIETASKLNIDLVDMSSQTVIRSLDVENFHRQRNGGMSPVSSQLKKGRIEASFLSHLKTNREEFSKLDSNFKLDLYRKFGAVIGDDVQLREGSILIAEQIVIGEGTVIEEDVSIQSKAIDIGAMGHFRSGLECNCKRVRVGEEAFFARGVIIGRGGSQEPSAELIIGNRVFIGERVLLNTGKPIYIGDSSFIGQFTSIMTHNIGHSYLDGYDNAFAPVVINNRVQVGVNCFIYPGVKIGSGTVISSNSSVIRNMPSNKMVAGVPAKVIGPATRELTDEELSRRYSEIVRRFIGLLEARRIKVATEKNEDGDILTFDYDEKRLSILFTEKEDLESLADYSVLISLAGGDFTPKKGHSYFDLKKLEFDGEVTPVSEGVREFLRKVGIKLSPWPWRYRGGLL